MKQTTFYKLLVLFAYRIFNTRFKQFCRRFWIFLKQYQTVSSIWRQEGEANRSCADYIEYNFGHFPTHSDVSCPNAGVTPILLKQVLENILLSLLIRQLALPDNFSNQSLMTDARNTQINRRTINHLVLTKANIDNSFPNDFVSSLFCFYDFYAGGQDATSVHR